MRLDAEFSRRVALDPGYRWVDGEAYVTGPLATLADVPVDRRWLVEEYDVQLGGTSFLLPPPRFRMIRPLLDEPALFRALADLPDPLTEDAVLGFVERYGMLGRGSPSVLVSVRDTLAVLPSATKPATVGGESLRDWQDAPREMRRAVSMWLAVARRDIAAAEALYNPFAYPLTPLASVERALNDLVTRQLASAQVRLARSDMGAAGELEISPENLLDALWLQLASAIERGVDYRRCVVCAKWFEMAPNARRKDQRYCSTACRSRAYRERRADAARTEGAVDEQAPGPTNTPQPSLDLLRDRRRDEHEEP